MAPVGEAITPRHAATVTFEYGGYVGGSKGRGKGVPADGRRLLKQPRGISFDPADGSLLVADFGNHCVYRFATDGDGSGCVAAGEEGYFLIEVDPMKDIDKPLGPPEGEGRLLNRPIAIAPCADGFYVLDCQECRVQRFAKDDKNAGAAVVVVPAPGSTAKKSVHQPEALKYPRQLLPCEDGSIIVCDTWSHRVLKFPPAGAVGEDGRPAGPAVMAGHPNSCGTRADQLAFPSSIAVAQDGSLLVTDTNNHRIQRFSPGAGASAEGKTIFGSASGKAGAGLGELNMPTGICIDIDGSILVADRFNSRVLRLRDGAKDAEVVAGSDLVNKPWGVCVGDDGAVYVSDEREGRVLRIGGRQLELRVQAPKAVKAVGKKAKAAEQAKEPTPESAPEPAVKETPAPKLVLNADANALD